MSFAFIFPGGKMVQDVNAITLVNNTQLITDITVPANKRWLMLNIRIVNADDVARDVYITKFDVAGKTNSIKTYTIQAVGAGANVNIPNNQATAYDNLLGALDIWIAGNTLEVIHQAGGASTGAADADGIVLEYLELDA